MGGCGNRAQIDGCREKYYDGDRGHYDEVPDSLSKLRFFHLRQNIGVFNCPQESPEISFTTRSLAYPVPVTDKVRLERTQGDSQGPMIMGWFVMEKPGLGSGSTLLI